jgi:hypothetical protein
VSASPINPKNRLSHLSGETLELALEEIRTAHKSLVEANNKLKDEIQHSQSIAAIVVSLMMALSTPAVGLSRAMITVATILLILAVLGSFFLLFSRLPSRALGSDESLFLLEEGSTITADAIRRRQLTEALELSKAGREVLKLRTLYVNLVKAALASSIVFIASGLLLKIM